MLVLLLARNQWLKNWQRCKKSELIVEVKILAKFFIEMNWKMGDMPNKFMILAKSITRQDF